MLRSPLLREAGFSHAFFLREGLPGDLSVARGIDPARVYPLSQVPEKYQWIFRLNPNGRLIEAYRYAMIDNISPPLGSVGIITALAIASLAIGYFIFKKLEGAFADYI